MMNGPDYEDCCPDCGEPLQRRRGVVPLTATRYCPSCNWCEVADGGRQSNAVEDWVARNVRNEDHGKEDDDGEE
jgi:uncharacterized Zn finger protein (UPF0148 family)